MKTGQRVEVYKNLHKTRQSGKTVYSVRDVKSGLVVGHVSDIALQDCQFKVNESGRQRCLREKRKNVHAVIRGTICEGEVLHGYLFPVTYNPYKYYSFVSFDHMDKPFSVANAKYVFISGKDVRADL